jgi:UDP-N-acetylglucosamine 1-carboxyvinyltransferase
MIVAGLGAEGETLLFDEGHITRGYERFDARLRALGADVVLEY